MKPLRLAVIGAGHLGRIHARIAAALPHIELVAVVDTDVSARERTAAETGAKPVADYRAVADDVEAGIVATPTCTHHAIAGDLIDRGISVLIEKPLAMNRAEASDLTQRAAEKEVILQVGHVERFNPALRCVEAELRAPKYIEAVRFSSYSFRSTDIGVVLDLMIHDLDIVLALVRSSVRTVEALGLSVLGGHEDMASARLTFTDGCIAQLTASRVSYEMRRQMQVATTRSFTSIDFAAGQTTVVKPREEVLQRRWRFHDLSTENSQDVAYWKDQLFHQVLVKQRHDPPAINAIEEEQRQFVTCIRHGQTPLVDGHAGSNAVAVAEAILQQIDDHCWHGHSGGRRGPMAVPALSAIDQAAANWQGDSSRHRRAG